MQASERSDKHEDCTARKTTSIPIINSGLSRRLSDPCWKNRYLKCWFQTAHH